MLAPRARATTKGGARGKVESDRVRGNCLPRPFLLARHWPRGARVLRRRQKARFLPAAAVVLRLRRSGVGATIGESFSFGAAWAARRPGVVAAGKRRGFCRLRLWGRLWRLGLGATIGESFSFGAAWAARSPGVVAAGKRRDFCRLRGWCCASGAHAARMLTSSLDGWCVTLPFVATASGPRGDGVCCRRQKA
jgi:hypothetical protein